MPFLGLRVLPATKASAVVAAFLLAFAFPGIPGAAAGDAGGPGYESYDDPGPYDSAADDGDQYEDGQEVPDPSYFRDELADQGTWVDHPTYGEVWTPRGVDRDWRPYSRGHWANTEEYGWYWVSDEPFGWATYHYGRWYLDPRFGWVWVPGTRWGPAWVAWRSSDAYVGWAPLPPEAYWEPNYGLRYSQVIYTSPRYTPYWSFVSPAYVASPGLYLHFVPRERTRFVIYETRPQTNYVFVNRRIVNRGVSVTRIETVTKTKITRVRVETTENRSIRGIDKRDGTTVSVFRPKLTHVKTSRTKVVTKDAEVKRFRDVDRRFDNAKKLNKAKLSGTPGTNLPAPYNASPYNASPGGGQGGSGAGKKANKAYYAPNDAPKAKKNRNQQSGGGDQFIKNGQGGGGGKRAQGQGKHDSPNQGQYDGPYQGKGKSARAKGAKDCVPPYCANP